MPGWDSITLAVNGVYGPRYCVCLHDRDFVQALVCNHQRVIVTVRSGELINTRLESLDEENLYLRDLRVLDVDGSVEYQDGDAVAREDVKSITVGESELGAIQSLMRRGTCRYCWWR